jgi:hypothetical protein
MSVDMVCRTYFFNSFAFTLPPLTWPTDNNAAFCLWFDNAAPRPDPPERRTSEPLRHCVSEIMTPRHGMPVPKHLPADLGLANQPLACNLGREFAMMPGE